VSDLLNSSAITQDGIEYIKFHLNLSLSRPESLQFTIGPRRAGTLHTRQNGIKILPWLQWAKLWGNLH
jgi:hypothetical protein